ncbi:hypothetical protein ABKA04_008722 [Annulohypoxylon sp. FPYF3050]
MVLIQRFGALSLALASIARASYSDAHWYPTWTHSECEKETVTETKTKTKTEVETCYETTTVYGTTTVFSTISYGYTVTTEDVITSSITLTEEETITASFTTTDEETTTQTATYTSLVPTITTETFTYTTQIPTTVVSDETLTTTEYSTSIFTSVSTYSTSILSTLTSIFTTTDVSVSASPTTDFTTVTATEATTSFVTLISTTTFLTVSEVTLTDSTVSSTTFTTTQLITSVVPTTISQLVTNVVPTTITAPPNTITEPPVTVTVSSVITAVTTCAFTVPPSTTVTPYDVKSNLTWGCPPSSICQPPFPEPGCNIWATPPNRTYVCESASYCIDAPEYYPVRWPIFQTGWYRSTPGYFNLAPPAFGLSYDVFAEETVETTITTSGQTYVTTVETGDWTSQASITEFSTYVETYAPYPAISKRSRTLPASCYDTCNNAYLEAQKVGKVPALCDTNSIFRSYTQSCHNCAQEQVNWLDATEDYWYPTMSQFLDFCNATNPVPILNLTESAAGAVGTSAAGSTTSGAAPSSNTGFISAIPGSTTLACVVNFFICLIRYFVNFIYFIYLVNSFELLAEAFFGK